jgi:hypothetical protein
MLGALAALAIAFVAFFALRGGSDGLNPVAEAAERTARQPGAHLALEVTYSVEGVTNPIVGTGTGAYNARTGRTEATLTVPIPGAPAVIMESVGNDRVSLLRSPMFAGELPSGTEWLGMEPLLGRSSETAFGTNGGAGSTLETLKAVGGVERLDQQKVRGHLTTRYKGQIDPAKAAQFLDENGEAALAHEYEVIAEKEPAPIQVEAWVDGRGLTRQIRMVQQLPTSAGPAVTMDMRMQFFRFGAQPKIKFPPKRRVLDYTPVLRAELGMIDGSTLGPLRPPAGAKPLPTSVFRRRVKGICHAVVGEVEDLLRRQTALIHKLKALGLGSLQSNEAKAIAVAYGRRLEEPAYRVVRHATGQLAALVPPVADEADYRRYLELDAKQSEWIYAEARGLQLGAFKLPVLESHKSEGEEEARERKTLADKMGIGSCEKGGSQVGAAPTEPA